MAKSVKIIVTKGEIEDWVKQVTIYAMGSIRVGNSGGWFARVDKGIYTIIKNGHEEIRKTSSRKRLFEIIMALINRYNNFQYKGFSYYYDKGSWWRFKVD